MNDTTTYSKKKYDYHWKQVSIRPATKVKLDQLRELLSTEYATVNYATIIDKLITDKYNSLTQ